jgi:hypothetical protein
LGRSQSEIPISLVLAVEIVLEISTIDEFCGQEKTEGRLFLCRHVELSGEGVLIKQGLGVIVRITSNRRFAGVSSKESAVRLCRAQFSSGHSF